ncbi:hypothetical protein Gbth_087_002 [Gluconobacter thailandicus F149-1 = NBRC 100600]|uniref:Phage protein n=1 Tax=Gluconobacter thailandicus NBRC 3257 TaxID=1381097 RepID=A0ABQ0ITT3_GLUTH|nr:hypothetical protein [Gluconobacter thailandicus]KXV54024.1 hypothetical protein AD946_04785 [Gluconobacter thailandicus]GAC88866.1 hypothetical protein NBRC3255_2527 [Gluconobacter thailandicus NBRC 3255]GAD25615.1 hypothetical protein NBRC3257_0614 [Gluconobacter thailandicus NBRC 3257]GAN94745.1 hypothetical protein Gbth_087_002 [Gluconobacter thailandicus F149-1 = NBRC 100600]GBR61698.1 hypothetical protein AA100600_3029 [Gluconobacter thailandicus F149-1 = NBRC 100600]
MLTEALGVCLTPGFTNATNAAYEAWAQGMRNNLETARQKSLQAQADELYNANLRMVDQIVALKKQVDSLKANEEFERKQGSVYLAKLTATSAVLKVTELMVRQGKDISVLDERLRSHHKMNTYGKTVREYIYTMALLKTLIGCGWTRTEASLDTLYGVKLDVTPQEVEVFDRIPPVLENGKPMTVAA